jgi:predicted secreted protein
MSPSSIGAIFLMVWAAILVAVVIVVARKFFRSFHDEEKPPKPHDE